MMIKGTLVDWDDEHCLGYIRTDGGPGDIVVVLASDLASAGLNSLVLGQRVEFKGSGACARDVVLIGANPDQAPPG